MLLCIHFALQQLFLLGFSFHLFPGLFEDAFVEVHDVLLLFGSEFGSHGHLLVEYLPHVVGPGLMVVLLLLLFSLVEMLAKLLDFAPLVITNIGGEVINWDLSGIWRSRFNLGPSIIEHSPG